MIIPGEGAGKEFFAGALSCADAALDIRCPSD
jgi:hypothetical protein